MMKATLLTILNRFETAARLLGRNYMSAQLPPQMIIPPHSCWLAHASTHRSTSVISVGVTRTDEVKRIRTRERIDGRIEISQWTVVSEVRSFDNFESGK